MAAAAISYPAFCFNQGTVSVAMSDDELTTCTKAALDNGWFDGLRIIDAAGTDLRVRGAKFVRGVGPLGGWNVFLNRRIKVELEFEPDAKPASVDELKKILRKSFSAWHGWESRGDLDELRRRLDSASSREDVLAFLREEVAGR